MKKALAMAALMFFPRLLAAQDAQLDDFLGESWYGLYMNGAKVGYSSSGLEKDGQGRYVATESSRFQISMGGIKQDMHIESRRVYASGGSLETIDQQIQDPAGLSEFHGRVQGDQLVLQTMIGGETSTRTFPKPKESLNDTVKFARWVTSRPQPGDSIESSTFDPLHQQEISGTSYLLAMEERLFEGVMTKVYKVKTVLDVMGVESLTYIAEDGTTLEDVISGIITMRLEPEHIAKDVDYSNDVIVSNAAMVDTPIEKPRTRESLRLEVRGPLEADHLFNDERQSMELMGDAYLYLGKKVDLTGFDTAKVPVEEEQVKPFLRATQFVQSDHPRIIAKAKEIAGDETDTLKISNKLCAWVHDNMQSTFSARLTNALEVLENLDGDCTEHSVLFVALARAAGVPAREVAGLIYVEGPSPGFYFHQWAKVWVGKWVDVDPTYDQPIADVTHIKLAEGDLMQQARLIPVIGKLKIKVLDE